MPYNKPMTMKIEMEFEFVDNLIDWDDKEQVEWLLVCILPASKVVIHSEEIGDSITKNQDIIYTLKRGNENLSSK